jgi:hypothetical protein
MSHRGGANDHEPTEREAAEDGVLDEVLKEALDKYGGLLTAEERAAAAPFLRWALATHPTTVELLEQIVPARQVEESGKVPKDGDEVKSPEGGEDAGGQAAGGAG